MREEVITLIYQYGKEMEPQLLLGLKKKKFGEGKYNGFGGGVEKGETLEEAAIRETLEEARIHIMTPERWGKILFTFDSGEQNHLVHFFKVRYYGESAKETEEMKPQLFNLDKIPYEKMWEDDKYWLPLLLQRKKFKGIFHYDSNSKIKNYKLNEVNQLR